MRGSAVADHASTLDLDEVTVLLVAKIKEVMALEGEVALDARFDEDLHADSLDLVEVVESVEQHLRGQGHRLSVDDEALLAAQTVGEAAATIAAGLDDRG